MANDNSAAFAANPTLFIAVQPIALNDIAQDMGGGFPVVNNQRSRFTLSTGPAGGAPGLGDLPMLRMQPAAVAVGGVVAQGGGLPALPTLDAYYCHAGNGGMAFNALPYVDIPIAPGGGDAHFLFTTGMNGCTLAVASTVGPGAAALPPGHWRVMHDHDFRSLAQWAAAGYVLRVAGYADGAQPGPVPGGWAVPPTVLNYNPHNYPFQFVPPGGPPRVRVVTNFLWWDGVVWNFGSRHFHASGPLAFDIDAPPGVLMPLSSTQTVVL